MNLDRKFMLYAAGAAAAATGGAQSADAAVVYSSGFHFNVGDTKDLDFDHNGTADLTLGHERTDFNTANEKPTTDRLILKDPTSGGSEAYVINPETTGNLLPAPVVPGGLIGPDSTYSQQFNGNVGNRIVDEDTNNNNILDSQEELEQAALPNFAVDNIVGNPQYLGVRFKLNNTGEDRYGYIGIDITNADDLTGDVTSFAYDDTGAPIEAGAVPEPSSGLALLALGAAGMLRRKRA